MKATELRIGNYVNIKNRFGEIVQIEINGISARQNVYDEDDSAFGCEELIPIKLTEEWLLKLLFLSNPYDDCYLKDDFRIEYKGKSIHVLNAPSPAATACLAIGDEICKMADKHFSLK